MEKDVWIVQEKGDWYKNFRQLEQEIPQNWKTELNLEHTYEFNDKYLEMFLFGNLKI